MLRGYNLSVNLFVLVNGFLMVVILWRGFAQRWTRYYPWFTTFIGYSLASLISLVLLNNLASWETYRYFYEPIVAIRPILMLGVLAESYGLITSRHRPMNGRWLLLILVVAGITLPFTFEISRMVSGDWFYTFFGSILFLEVLLATLVGDALLGHPEIAVGRNLRGIVLGSILLLSVQLLNIGGIFTRHLSFEMFQAVAEGVFTVALVVFAAALWSYEPVRKTTRTNLTRVFKRLLKATISREPKPSNREVFSR